MHLRLASPEDATAIATIYNQGIEDRIATFETRLRTPGEIEQWFDGVHPIVVLETDERQVIAFASTSVYRPRPCYAGIAEFSVYVERPHRGRGAGRLALERLLQEAQKAGFWKLVSRVFVENADATFDLIVSNLGMNNFPDPGAVLAECFRVAKAGARLVLTTNPTEHLSEFYEVFRQILWELQKPASLERLQAHEAHRGTKESLSALLLAAGFRVVKVREDRFHLRYLDGSAFFHHFLTQLGFLDDWRRVVDQEDEEHVFALLEHRLNQVARAAGELRMNVPMLYLEGEKPDGEPFSL